MVCRLDLIRSVAGESKAELHVRLSTTQPDIADQDIVQDRRIVYSYNMYVNDEKICLALAAMWAQIGVTTRVNTMPRANYFPKLEKHDTSLYMLGWGGGAVDPIFILQPPFEEKDKRQFGYSRGKRPGCV